MTILKKHTTTKYLTVEKILHGETLNCLVFELVDVDTDAHFLKFIKVHIHISKVSCICVYFMIKRNFKKKLKEIDEVEISLVSKHIALISLGQNYLRV
jgi:hypothetical protein